MQSMCALLRPVGAYSLREDSLVYIELLSYYAGLRLVEEEIALLEREGLVPAAEGFGLKTWEHIIRSTALTSSSADDRRQIVLYTLSRMPGDFNLEGMLRGLHSIGLTCTVEENVAAQTVSVVVSSYAGTLRAYEDVLARVVSILPAHVNVALDIGALTWEQLDIMDWSFNEQDARDETWDEFELMQP